MVLKGLLNDDDTDAADAAIAERRFLIEVKHSRTSSRSVISWNKTVRDTSSWRIYRAKTIRELRQRVDGPGSFRWTARSSSSSRYCLLSNTCMIWVCSICDFKPDNVISR